MAFDWRDFVEASRFLEQHAAGSGQQEAFLRSAISRAYYGAFCHARNYARDHLGFQPGNNADDHGRLHARLKKGKLQGLSVRLERLREWRNECDYADNLGFDPQEILKLAIKQAFENHFQPGSPGHVLLAVNITTAFGEVIHDLQLLPEACRFPASPLEFSRIVAHHPAGQQYGGYWQQSEVQHADQQVTKPCSPHARAPLTLLDQRRGPADKKPRSAEKQKRVVHVHRLPTATRV